MVKGETLKVGKKKIYNFIGILWEYLLSFLKYILRRQRIVVASDLVSLSRS